jgi:hypothetical protein
VNVRETEKSALCSKKWSKLPNWSKEEGKKNFNNQLLQLASAASQPTASPPNAAVLDQSSMQPEKSSPPKSQHQLKSKLLEE